MSNSRNRSVEELEEVHMSTDFGTLSPGDLVRRSGSSWWHVVTRVNTRTVSVASGRSWAVRVPRSRIAETRKQQPTKGQP